MSELVADICDDIVDRTMAVGVAVTAVTAVTLVPFGC